MEHKNVDLYSFELFAGAGGGILASQMLRHRTIGAIEIETYPRKVLLARQLDGNLPEFPIWDDITTFGTNNPDTASYIERLRSIRHKLIIKGGFPCQDISVAGRGAGITGERSGLWGHMARIIGEIRPKYAFVENSPALVTRGLGTVLGDLAALGYDCKWTVLGAADVGAPHKRDRLWIKAINMADTTQLQCNVGKHHARISLEQKAVPEFGNNCGPSTMADASSIGQPQSGQCERSIGSKAHQSGQTSDAVNVHGRAIKPELGRAFDGLAERLDKPWPDDWEHGTPRVATEITARTERLKAIGNGQVPLCAATAFNMLVNKFHL